MTHLELENLASDYLEGLLDTARQREVETHLAGCEACRALIADVRRTMELCRTAEELEPAPWLVSKILLATVGERKPTWREQVAAFLRPALQPRVAYAAAMTVFSVSIIINAAGLNLRNLTLADLNPHTWFTRANVAGHRLYARAEKFYFDLRVVYEIESRFRQFRAQPQEQQKDTTKPQAPPGGTTDRKAPGNPQLASNGSTSGTLSGPLAAALSAGETLVAPGTGRSPTP